jgi:SSS family transporter
MNISLQWNDIISIIIYLLIIILIGVFFTRGTKTTEGYFLGGRSIPWWAVGISYMMSLYSTLSLVAAPGEIYNYGLTMSIFGFLYPILSIAFFFVFMRFLFASNVFTPFEYLEKRFSSNIRTLVGNIYIFTRIFYLAMVLYATSMVFYGGAGWDPKITIIIIGVIGTFYTVMGGMRAVVWTDVVQFVVLIIGIGLVFIICSRESSGGLIGAWDYAMANGRGPERFVNPEFYKLSPFVRLSFWVLIYSQVSQAIFYNSSDQISVQRLLSTSSYKQAKKAIFTNSLAFIPFSIILTVIGIMIYSYYGQNPDPNVSSGDVALFAFVSTKLPTPLPGIFFAAMLAAAMSTLDSGINSISGLLVKEIYVRAKKGDVSDRRQVKLMKWGTVLIGAIATIGGLGICIASTALKETVSEAFTIWTILGIVMNPVFLLGVTSRYITTAWIWRLTAWTFGFSFGLAGWYVISKSGFTAPLPWNTVILAASITAVMTISGMLIKKLSKDLIRALVKWFAILCGGAAFALLCWALCSRYFEPGDTGGALSFMWVSFPGPILFIVGGYIVAYVLSRRQRKPEHECLTLWSWREVSARLEEQIEAE